MKEAFIITDLSFGDAGKGTTVDFLARQQPSSAVIRYNGGPQAAHNVVTPDGRHHTFSQFGSGSFVPGVRTHLSEDMLINPLAMYPEAEHLQQLGVHDVWERLTVDALARVITPWHVAVNRLRERARGAARHGSCAHGVGETMADDVSRPDLTIHAEDLARGGLETSLETMRRYKLAQAAEEIGNPDDSAEWHYLQSADSVGDVAEVYSRWAHHVQIGIGHVALLADTHERLIFEGAQGVLLDEWYGFHPYTTWSTTTPENAQRQLADIGYHDKVITLGLVRAYTTRHGPGPFPTEDLTLSVPLREYHNGMGEWQGAFRYGHFDAVLHRYAIEVSGAIDGLVVTGIDRAADLPTWQYNDSYTSDNTPHIDQTGRHVIVGEKGDLVYQEALGETLFAVEPEYQQLTDPANILPAIEQILERPILIESYGPTSNDKLVKAM